MELESALRYPPIIYKIWGEGALDSIFPYNFVDDFTCTDFTQKDLEDLEECASENRELYYFK